MSKQQMVKSTSSPALSMYVQPKKAGSATTTKAKEPQFDYENNFANLEESERLVSVRNFISQLANEQTKTSAASSLTSIVTKSGLRSTESLIVLNFVRDTLKNPSPATEKEVREMALFLSIALSKVCGKSVEFLLVSILPQLFLLHADRSPATRELSASLCLSLSVSLSELSLSLLMPAIQFSLSHDDWRVKTAVLTFLNSLSPRAGPRLSLLLPTLIPLLSNAVVDSKRQVQLAAIEAMISVCKSGLLNDDLRPLVPALVGVIAEPDKTIATLDLLIETVFVAAVDEAVLALLSPLLVKVLRGRSSVAKRKAARVIDSMCRLVVDPRHVKPFEPILLPAIDKVIDEVVDAEVRDVVKTARLVLINALNGIKTDANGVTEENHRVNSFVPDVEFMRKYMFEAIKPVLLVEKSVTEIDTERDVEIESLKVLERECVEYISNICAGLVMHTASMNSIPVDVEEPWKVAVSLSDRAEWRDCIIPYLPIVCDNIVSAPPASSPVPSSNSSQTREKHEFSSSYDAIAHDYRLSALGGVKDAFGEDDVDDTSLCCVEFSLAFGGKILLQNTFLKLGKGKKYGIMGKNGTGKTTLLTNIGLGTIEGLPPTLRTVYVQPDNKSGNEDNSNLSVLDYLLVAPAIQEVGLSKEEGQKALQDVGFTQDMLVSSIDALSGGWKMKLLIVRAMLSQANVLLLDEPTNHLDSDSVAWLTSYLQAAHDVTCLIVTHDTVFMDNVVTDIIHYENRKLVYYHGNLSHFVKIHPEATHYFELSSSMRFRFPIPDRLDGINSNTRSVMKMEGVNFTYPGKTIPQLTDVNVKVCLGSRIAVLGANGAGKSTLIKLLVQETKPDCGEVWKHMNLRVAYVAQHSLHHVEQHLDSSPVDYIKWRFFGGVDRENLIKATMKLDEDEEKREKRFGDVDQCVGRRKNGRTMEYECTFIGQTARDPNKYITLEKMNEMGLSKMVAQCDDRVAAMAAGLDLRPLVIAEIQAHLDDFNLESEFGTHSTIKRLSGGQKVKLVLAAAMWNKPHIIVLDEPTNYLDREALGALTQAIKEFAGGVLIISHHSEFTNALCTEKWIVKDGRCVTEGEVDEKSEKTSVVKKSKSSSQLSDKKEDDSGITGNINSSIQSEVILNPKTLESLSKKEFRKLERLAIVAGMSVKEYVSKINSKSPEWKWL